MYRKNRSGQYLYFNLVSITSGLGITSGATSISGRRSIDGAAHTLVSGTFTELGGGQYVFNGYDFDFNGNNIGFLITASNACPISFTVVTNATLSGDTFLGSGSITSGLIASGIVFVASGAYTASGMFGTASLNSGQSVIPYSGQLSGQLVTAASGVTAIVVSGLSTISTLYSGQLSIPYSGQLSGQQVQVLTNLDKSGYTANSISGTTQLASGVFVFVYSGQLSGQLVTASSGAFASIASGNIFLSSGQLVNLLSGNVTSPYSGQMSGQYVTTQINLDKSGYTANSISGTTQLASGSITSGFPVTVASFLSGAAKSILIEGSVTSGTQLVNDSGIQLNTIDLPQAVAAILSTQAGKASGAGTAGFSIGVAGNPNTVNRIVATIDGSGNRSAVNLQVPN